MKKSTAPPRYKTAHIDSFNFSSAYIEELFRSDDFVIELVKGIGVFEPKRWLEVFKQKTTPNIVEAKIIHTIDGLVLPLKRQSRSPHKQTIEFAGIHNYNDSSKRYKALLRRLLNHIKDGKVTRIDIAIDFNKPISERVLRQLRKNRTPFVFRNSVYLKTDKEKKKNTYININLYPKHIKDDIAKEVYRLEFSFRGDYFKGNSDPKNLEVIILKMAKTIKKFTGLDIEIKPV